MSPPIAEPPVELRAPAPPVAPRRRLPFERLFDVRDLGGYRGADGRTVRWGTVYRADALGRVAAHAPDRALLAGMGLRTVVDLRTDAEHGAGGRLPDDLGVECFHHPVLAQTWDVTGTVPTGDGTDAAAAFLSARYVEMLDEGAGAIGSVLALLTDPDCLPLVFHSSVGKDRTGVVAAIVLSLLGVDDAVIAHDYGLSRFGTSDLLAWLARTSPEGHRLLLEQPAAYLDAPPSAIRHLLTAVRTGWGSVEAYADSLYVDADAVARIRTNLLSG